VTAVGVSMAGAGAVLGAARISTLQREAFEARREAQQVGAYTLQKQLGKGGMGEVWLAEHRLLKRPCAVKFVRADLAASPVTAARFEREVRAVTALTHFNTVRVYDYGRSEGSFYYVMEYLDGPSLEALVQRAGPLEPGRVVYLLRQLCGALAEAHAAGMVHRDLKPGNVIVAALGGQRDVAKLLDFGLVQDLSAAASDGRLTEAGVVMGTPAYMCPEQARGSSAIDPRGDVYSLGAVAFFTLTARPPFACATVGEFLVAHLTRPAPDVRSLRLDVPADLAEVVARCLAKEPDDRHQSAAELDAALAACACANDWSAARAAEWWERERTATFHKPEPTPK
jgi:eukaryotic-like serine/threonine-protein kinase